MRFLRNIVLFLIPCLIIINLYRYFNYEPTNTFEFRGFSYIFNHISTFNGFINTMNVIWETQTTATEFAHSMQVESVLDVLTLIGNFFRMVYLVFKIPIMFVVDIISDIVWVVNSFWGA